MLPRFSHLLRLALVLAVASLSAAPLRVLVVSDQDAIGADLAASLGQGGAQVKRATTPLAADLAAVDVALLYQSKFAAYDAAAQQALADFAKSGHGLVVVHGAIAGGATDWSRDNLGGGWTPESQKFRATTMLNIRSDAHPLVKGMSTFDVDDDTVFDLALNEKNYVLSASFTSKVTNARRKAEAGRASVYDIQPQSWVLEAPTHRAVVLLQGDAATLRHASIHTFLKRGVAWVAKRADFDELCTPADLADLRYPVGGPRRPADAVAQFRLQPGFKAASIVAEPLVNKPIAVQWDERGRLWVAETPEYPNGRRTLNAEPWKEGGVLVPGLYDRPAQDKISVLVSSKGDGNLDQKQVFHEGLELITGFCIWKDGVIVVAQKGIFWLRDTNGDGKSDQEVLLYGGFTPGDTHFVANHFIVAPDGWIYASNGTGGTATHAKSGEPMARLSSGTFRFKPDGSAIEQVASQGGNSFGNEVTSDMELYHGKATNGNPIQHVVLPEQILAKAPGTPAKAFNSVNRGRPVARADLPDRAPLMQIDQVGHYSAGCAAAVYEGGAWPKEYNGTVWMSEPILDIVHHEKLVLDGAFYRGELLLENKEWLRSSDHWFCPIDISFGPDGAMYILDFYTPVVAHNDTRGPQHSKSGASVRPDREHYFGRIYRIQHDAAPTQTHPDLAKTDAAGLVAAFTHPSKVVRFNAIRVLLDRDDATQAAAVAPLSALLTSGAAVEARIQALWALQRLGKLAPATLAAAAAAPEAALRKNAFLAAESGKLALPTAAFEAALADADGRVRLAALRAMGSAPLTADAGLLLLSAQSRFTDEWSKAAATAAASSNPVPTLEGLLAGSVASKEVVEFARSLAAAVATANQPEGIARVLAATAKGSNVAVAKVVLREFTERRTAPVADTQALKTLLASSDLELAAGAASLAVQWNQVAALGNDLLPIGERLVPVLADAAAAPAVRLQAGRTLTALRDLRPSFRAAVVAALTDKSTPESVSLAIVASVVAAGDVQAGPLLAGALGKSTGLLRQSLFGALISRAEWAQLILTELEAKHVSPMQLGPLQTSQLTRHPEPAVAKRAAKVLAKLNVGSSPAKDEIINKLRAEVEKPGDAAKGKELFVAACQTCHKIGNVGNDFGPNLQGIGSHPPAEMLVHIVDPNRMVDDEHRTWNIKMKDGTQYSALIGSENPTFVKLKLPAGQSAELKVADIVSRERSPNSLMPEGFESLGAEGLRNVIAYLRSVAISPEGETVGRFRLLDLRAAFTASTNTGLYANKEAKRDTLPFAKFGQVESNGVPYKVIDPKGAKDGLNVIVLKGGAFKGAYSKSFAQKVEIPVGSVANRIHFLGAVGGWGAHGDAIAMIAEVHFLSGKVQKKIFYGGVDFADYNGTGDVPKSKSARQLLSGEGRQVRTHWIPVESNEIIDKLVLSSADTEIAPTTVAVTIEIGGPPNPPAGKDDGAPKAGQKKGKANDGPSELLPKDNPKTTQAFGQTFAPRKAGQLRVLFAGAGSSHNFPAFFLGTDALTAKAAGYDIASTPNLKETLALLPEADLFVFSGNHAQFGTPEFQKAIRDFAAAGKGIVLLHAATWYNWPLTTKYNDEFVCGGSRNHGHSDFTFTVTKPEHPIMKGVPATFVINDESYNIELTRPEGAEVLGTIPRQTPKEGLSNILPSVWTVKYPGTKVVCIALGHDEHSHDHPAYQKLLLNALTWASQK
jgi:putative membrane-bound dehydrogenase-like protein